MKPFEPSYETKAKLWRRFSREKNDVVIYLLRCYVHTVEACVAVSRQEVVDEVELFVLKAIDLLQGSDLDGINGLLHIGRQIIYQIAAKMIRDETLSQDAHGVYTVTAAGYDAIQKGKITKLEQRRMLFHFIDNSMEFVKFSDAGLKRLIDINADETPSEWRFEIDYLKGCINRPLEWKQRRQFPMEIQDIVEPDASGESSPEADSDNSLVVDKAQALDCAIKVEYQNDRPVELSIYAASLKGFIGTTEPVLSLTDEQTIISVFPFINELPSTDQSKSALLALAEDYDLENEDSISVSSQPTCTLWHVKGDISNNWKRFYWKLVQGDVFCDISTRTAQKLNMLRIKSSTTTEQKIRLLYDINQQQKASAWPKEPFRPHFNSLTGVQIDPKVLSKLASMAWDIEKYQLAYNLSEIEDMADADL